jgi:hypothetical protein
MSAATVIADVTETLRQLLQDQQQPQGQFAVSLASPADEVVVPSMAPTANLFLFRVSENSHAKNQDWLPVGTGVLHKPPLALNLFYVLTPFAEDKLDEHRVLGEAMRIFYDNAIIADPLLSGALENSTEELKIDLCQFSLEELTRIWNALTRPYRLSVCYEVRIILVDSATERPTVRVTEKHTRYSQLAH